MAILKPSRELLRERNLKEAREEMEQIAEEQKAQDREIKQLRFERKYPRTSRLIKGTTSLVTEGIKQGRIVKRPSRRPTLPRPEPQRELSTAQKLMQSMFGNKNQTWGNGENKVRIKGELRTGGGLIKNGDTGYETASMFGIGGRRNG